MAANHVTVTLKMPAVPPVTSSLVNVSVGIVLEAGPAVVALTTHMGIILLAVDHVTVTHLAQSWVAVINSQVCVAVSRALQVLAVIPANVATATVSHNVRLARPASLL